MRMTYRIFAGKLFGREYGRLKKALPVWAVVFFGLRLSGLRVGIAPSALYLMAGAFSAGVMWQALSSADQAAYMKNLFMLPVEERGLAASYVAALGSYTLLTKTAGLFAVALAVSPCGGQEAVTAVAAAVCAVLMAACFYVGGKNHVMAGLFWVSVLLAAVFLASEGALCLLLFAGSGLAAALLLGQSDVYRFYTEERGEGRSARPAGWLACGRIRARAARGTLVWRYLCRYLLAHRNYLLNTVILWGIACVLPALLGQTEGVYVLPMGFAILSLNTPLCILLSCDPALEQAVRFLPGQGRSFFVPYGCFLSVSSLLADVIFLVSWQATIGGVHAASMLLAVCFAVSGAAGSVLLERFYPVRRFRIESDLWHHPRKYLVPAALLLLAGGIGMLP